LDTDIPLGLLCTHTANLQFELRMAHIVLTSIVPTLYRMTNSQASLVWKLESSFNRYGRKSATKGCWRLVTSYSQIHLQVQCSSILIQKRFVPHEVSYFLVTNSLPKYSLLSTLKGRYARTGQRM